MQARPTWTLALAAALLTGCPPKSDDDSADSGTTTVDCTADARASVQVQVVDDSGSAISGAVLTYDAGAGSQACEEMTAGEHVCGWEVGGTLHIVAEAEGYASAETDVVVEEDECHVITEMIELVLVAD